MTILFPPPVVSPGIFLNTANLEPGRMPTCIAFDFTNIIESKRIHLDRKS